MNLEDFKITSGINSHQNASIERNEKTIDYSSSKPLSYADILSITKGLNVISEFFDVNAVVTVSGTNISAVALENPWRKLLCKQWTQILLILLMQMW